MEGKSNRYHELMNAPCELRERKDILNHYFPPDQIKKQPFCILHWRLVDFQNFQPRMERYEWMARIFAAVHNADLIIHRPSFGTTNHKKEWRPAAPNTEGLLCVFQSNQEFGNPENIYQYCEKTYTIMRKDCQYKFVIFVLTQAFPPLFSPPPCLKMIPHCDKFDQIKLELNASRLLTQFGLKRFSVVMQDSIGDWNSHLRFCYTEKGDSLQRKNETKEKLEVGSVQKKNKQLNEKAEKEEQKEKDPELQTDTKLRKEDCQIREKEENENQKEKKKEKEKEKEKAKTKRKVKHFLSTSQS